jgi:uncharacterized circularly permuted ATP-grasp superfamily protein
MYNEIKDWNGHVRPELEDIWSYFESLSTESLSSKTESLQKLMFDLGITFNVYSDISGAERIIPFDIIPRIINGKDWVILEKGIEQRILALNLFLNDVYSNQHIIKDGIIPADIVLGSKGYVKECLGLKPLNNVYTHISGIDIIRDDTGKFLVLEDNLRCPSGVSYMLQNRELSKKGLFGILEKSKVRPIGQYTDQLLETLKCASNAQEPNVVVLSPGPYNSAYYEHSYLALQMGVELVENKDLVVEKDIVYVKTINGKKKVDVIYRRIDEQYLDPTLFKADSLLGIPGIFNAYKKGNLSFANALGTGVADDKVIYAFVPEMIKYYLGEEPLIENVHTYLCKKPESMLYVLNNLDKLVVKEANEAGGYGMLIGPSATKTEIKDFRLKIKSNPENYIAQPVISLSTTECFQQNKFISRHIDLRPYVLYGKNIYVNPGGLTRVALKEGSLVVNSSQGGGTKDTWVINN